MATSLTFRLHPIEPTVAGVLVHPLPRFREVLSLFREHTAAAPNELGLIAAVETGPGGVPAAMIIAQHTGALDKGHRMLAPIRAFGRPVADTIQAMPYSALVHALDGQDPPGRHYAMTCRGIPELTDTVLDVVAAYATSRTSAGTSVVMYRQHGAAAEKPADYTAYSGRHLPYMVGIYAGWDDEAAAPHLAWLAEFKAALAPYTVAPGCVSLVGEEGLDVVRENFGPNFTRLQRIKAQWDPENLFCHNHNIPPEA